METDNIEKLDPYQPPLAEISAAPPADYETARLYKFGHIAMATFVGSTAAGFLLIALNYRTFGRPDESRKSIITGIVVTVAVLVIAFFLPENFPAIIFNIAAMIGVQQYAQLKQKTLFAEFLDNGATLHSGWRAFGISLLCVLVVLLFVAAAIFVFFVLNPDELRG